MLKKKPLFLLASSIPLALAVMALSVNRGPLQARAEGTPNDVTAANTDAFTSSAVTIDYTGTKTSIYGIQAYAGVAGPMWVVGSTAPVVEKGAGSHSLGSNNSDGRSGLILTFNVSSTVAGAAYLGVYGQFNEYSGATLVVNGGAGQTIALADLGMVWADTTPSFIPLSLQSGDNVITLTMQDNYTGWFGSFFVAPTNALVSKDGYNDDHYCNRNVPETSPVQIDYAGTLSKVYGIQSYAGMKGPAWAVSGVAGVLEDGSSSHNIGSNTGDGRSGFEMSFLINSTVAGEANLNIYAEMHDNAATTTGATLNVNGTTSSINFYSLNTVLNNNKVPTRIPVTLIAGVNTLSVTMQSNYEIWVGSWSVGPKTGTSQYLDYSQINISCWENKTGDMSADAYSFGLNAYDDAANYGKSGGVDYNFTCDTAGDYYLALAAMAGAPFANRAKITVNDVVYRENGHDYVSFITSAGWSGDSMNRYRISLVSGVNHLHFENSLACLSADKSQEVAAGTTGSILVSNWWVHGITLSKVPTMELVLDTTACQTIYNLGREFSSQGLVVQYKEGETLTTLDSDAYSVDSSAFHSNLFGSYEIVVKKNDDATIRSSYYVSVGDNGRPYAGTTLAFDGTATGEKTHSFYKNAQIAGEGTAECADRIFWYDPNKVLADGGYVMGSAGVGENENRQMTLTLHIQSSVSGRYLLKANILTNDRDNATLGIKVNEGSEERANLFYSGDGLPFMYAVDLVNGLNTITFRTDNQYNFWWTYFELTPISYGAVGTAQNANQGVRAGEGVIDSDAGDVWAANEKTRSLEFFYQVAASGNYRFEMATSCSEAKKASVFVDGTEHAVDVINGTTTLALSLEAGNHSFKVAASGGTTTAFSLSKVNLVKDLKALRLVVDTSAANLSIPYDGIFDTTTIKAAIEYDDGSKKDLTPSEFTIVTPEGFSTKKPGTYTLTVVLKSDDTLKGTFQVTVGDALVSIAVSQAPTKTSYQIGEALDLSGLVVEGTMAGGSKSTISVTAEMVSGFDSSKAGEETLTITYQGLTTTFKVTIKAAASGGCGGCGGNGATAAISSSLLAFAGVLSLALFRKKHGA